MVDAVLLGLPGLSAPGASSWSPIVVSVEVGEGELAIALHIAGAGLACCSVELMAAALRSPEAQAAGLAPAADVPAAVDVLVVAGTLTHAMAPGLVALHASLPEGTPVLSFGACSASGGPYWDSYSVAPGVGDLVPVDVYVPGCPPRPEALVDGLRHLPGVAS